MFERLDNRDGYWRRMCEAVGRAWRQVGSRRCPEMILFGWTVYVVDGKAYLFHRDRKYCRRCDWFDLCYMLRAFGLR